MNYFCFRSFFFDLPNLMEYNYGNLTKKRKTTGIFIAEENGMEVGRVNYI